MTKLFVAITDADWFQFLSSQSALDEVNFWQPSGRVNFKALQTGELFLFKLHSPNNFIVGGGFFGYASIVPVSMAWEVFGEKNGVRSFSEMRARIARYRRELEDQRSDYTIGCRILEQPFFLRREAWIPVPESWAPNTQVGRTYNLEETDGKYLWEAVSERLATPATGFAEEQARYGVPTLIKPRLGQGAFRIAVIDAYTRRCAVTGERTLPVLNAAHIRPYSEGGAHAISNGISLRSDLHTLFDRGYVTITKEHRFEVSRRIKEDFENGRDYYALQGKPILLPVDVAARPNSAALEWHRTERYLT